MLKSKAKEKSAAMAALMEEYDSKFVALRSTFSPGEILKGTVLSIGTQYLVIDINAKIQGVLDVALYNGSDEPMPKEGDTVEVCFVEMLEDGSARLTLPGASADATNHTLEEAYLAKQPVEGVFDKEIKGGFEVKLCNERAFCPYSQVALRRPREGAPSPIGQTQTFLIIEYKPQEHTLVVSHRALEERERDSKIAALHETLREGDLYNGVITKIMPFGVFVDIGGLEGLIPNSEISWDRSVKPSEIIPEGSSVQVICRKIDWEANRFTFSLKDTKPDPWLQFAEEAAVGDRLNGTVVRLMPFGAFVQLRPGVEGLIPISRLGNGRSLAHSSEVLKEGQTLFVKIESIDPVARRLSLSVVSERVEALKPGEIAVGAELKGIVESIRPFGVFVRLSEDKTGLLHASETGIERGPQQLPKMQKAFPEGSDITVIVSAMTDDRISLTLPSMVAVREQEKADAENLREMLKSTQEEASNAGLGNLGSIFDSLLK